jgi:hypothetical protein
MTQGRERDISDRFVDNALAHGRAEYYLLAEAPGQELPRSMRVE